MYVCMYYEGVRSWSYRQLLAAMWVLGIEPETFGKTLSALNC